MEATKLLEELKEFYEKANFQRTKDILQKEIKNVEGEIAAAKAKSLQNAEESSGPKRILVDLHEHAVDESDKFVKIYIPFDLSKISEENVEADFSENSFQILIHGNENKDHRFVVNNLLKPIDVTKSYKKKKSDMVAVYLKKANEGSKWGFLTTTEKKLKDGKNKPFEDEHEKEEVSKDPMGGLMNIMKKMYDSGDAEMKRTIAKAWTEGQEKSRQNPMI